MINLETENRLIDSPKGSTNLHTLRSIKNIGVTTVQFALTTIDQYPSVGSTSGKAFTRLFPILENVYYVPLQFYCSRNDVHFEWHKQVQSTVR